MTTSPATSARSSSTSRAWSLHPFAATATVRARSYAVAADQRQSPRHGLGLSIVRMHAVRSFARSADGLTSIGLIVPGEDPPPADRPALPVRRQSSAPLELRDQPLHLGDLLALRRDDRVGELARTRGSAMSARSLVRMAIEWCGIIARIQSTSSTVARLRTSQSATANASAALAKVARFRLRSSCMSSMNARMITVIAAPAVYTAI